MKSTTIYKVLSIIVLALAALAAGMAFSTKQDSAPQLTDAVALQQLMSLKLPDALGQETPLEQWRGEILVVNFWATWCPPCKEEMPAFSRLQETWKSHGVHFIGIAVDSAENVEAFASQHPVTYPLLVGGNDIISLSKDLGNQRMGLPFTLIIDTQGKIHARKLGGVRETELETLLNDLTSQQ